MTSDLRWFLIRATLSSNDSEGGCSTVDARLGEEDEAIGDFLIGTLPFENREKFEAL